MYNYYLVFDSSQRSRIVSRKLTWPLVTFYKVDHLHHDDDSSMLNPTHFRPADVLHIVLQCRREWESERVSMGHNELRQRELCVYEGKQETHTHTQWKRFIALIVKAVRKTDLQTALCVCMCVLWLLPRDTCCPSFVVLRYFSPVQILKCAVF